MKYILIYTIKFYKNFISVLFPPSCRFHPTCSEYSLQSIQKFGALRGGWLSVKRIVRCNPFNPGGYDPVPDEIKKFSFKNIHFK